MTRVLAASLLLAACYTSVPPSPPAPAAPLAQRPRAVTTVDESLCCCTFDFAGPEDFGDVRTWDSLASRCLTGGGGTVPGQCIAWSFCGYVPGTEPRSLAQRPDLRPPPPLAADECCCSVADISGEELAVRPRAECHATTYGSCLDAGFCGRDDP